MSTHIPLTEAARLIGVTYHTLRNWVLRGTVAGGRDPYGRWVVSHRAVRRLGKRRGALARSKAPSR